MRSKTSAFSMKKIIILTVLIFLLYSCWNNIENQTEIIKANTTAEVEIITENINESEVVDMTENINIIENNNLLEKSFATIWVDEFKKEIENSEVTLIDIRNPSDLPIYGKLRKNQLHIYINSENFASEISKLDKTKKYAIYCRKWIRSQAVKNYMGEQGFVYIKVLEWWSNAWIEAWEKTIK